MLSRRVIGFQDCTSGRRTSSMEGVLPCVKMKSTPLASLHRQPQLFLLQHTGQRQHLSSAGGIPTPQPTAIQRSTQHGVPQLRVLFLE